MGSTHSVLVTLGLPCSRRMCFPHLHCSGSGLLYREQALRCMHFPGLSCSGSDFQVFHKDTDWAGPVFCAFPGWSSSGSQELEEHTLPWCSVPYPLHGPSLSFCALVWHTLCLFWEADFWLQPSRQMSTIQNLRKSLVRDWKPVFSLVGDAISGAEFAPILSPLPPEGDGLVHSWYSLSPLFWEQAGSTSHSLS